MTKSLTKENFFNAIGEKYPDALALFCKWIDDYKKEVGWDELFGNNRKQFNRVKFHDIPFEMQVGIMGRFFEIYLKTFTSELDPNRERNVVDEYFMMLQNKIKEGHGHGH